MFALLLFRVVRFRCKQGTVTNEEDDITLIYALMSKYLFQNRVKCVFYLLIFALNIFKINIFDV